jgi:hypothetical protein
MDMLVIPNRGRVVAVMLALALVGGLLTLALLAKPSQAQPPTDNENRGATSDWFRIGFTIDTTACTGELIQLTGTLHFVNQFFETDGGYHLRTNYNLTDGRGVGLTSGEEYIVTAAGGTIENFVPAGDVVVGGLDTQVLIGKGQADDLVATAQFHYILEVVEGEEPTVKVETTHVNVECH